MVAGFYSSKASTQKTQASRYRISICLKIREWASIALERRPLFEHAARASLGRSSNNRRRNPRAKGFSPKCVPVPAGLCFRVYRDLLCNIVIFSRLLRPPSVLRDIRKGEPRHWRYAKCAFLPEPAQQMYYTADNNEMQVFPRLTCVNSNTQLTSHPIHAIKILTFIQNASSTPGCRVSGIRLYSVRAARRQRGEVLCLFCYSGLKQTQPGSPACRHCSALGWWNQCGACHL